MRNLRLGLVLLPLLVVACGDSETSDSGGTAGSGTSGSGGSAAGAAGKSGSSGAASGSSGSSGATSGSGGTAGASGSTAGKGGSSGTGGSTAGSGGSTSGAGGATGGSSGSSTSGAGGSAAGSSGAGGSGAGAGGAASGSGGSTAGTAGSSAGAGGTAAGAGGTAAGAGGTAGAAGDAGAAGAAGDAGAAGSSGAAGDAGAAGASGAAGAGGSGSDSAPMVPGGAFKRANATNLPATVSPFRLDRLQVTVGDFRTYHDQLDTASKAALDAALATCQVFEKIAPAWTASPGANESIPMNCLTRAQADAYCVWSGGKLPTFAQMSFAQVGGDEQRFFPWSSPPSSQTIDMTLAAYESNFPSVQPVGSFPLGAGRYGHLDLAGNQWNLTLDDDVTPPTPCDDCIGTGNPTRSIRVGGSFSSPKSRLQNNQFDGHPDVNRSDDGFRCARPM